MRNTFFTSVSQLSPMNLSYFVLLERGGAITLSQPKMQIDKYILILINIILYRANKTHKFNLGVHDRERRFKMSQYLLQKDDEDLIKTAFQDESYFTLGKINNYLLKFDQKFTMCPTKHNIFKENYIVFVYNFNYHVQLDTLQLNKLLFSWTHCS